jgi:hypothetical protein
MEKYIIQGGYMLLKTLHFVSLLCAALVLGLTLTHDLEIPGKRALSGEEWIVVQHTFYGGFAIVGGLSEVIGLISTGILAFLLRRQRTPFILTLVAAICFAGTLVVFALGNQPLNQQVAEWRPETLPANWRAVRDAWDGFHATSSALAAISFITLLVSILREAPSFSVEKK